MTDTTQTMSASEALDALFSGGTDADAGAAGALLAAAPPRGGKTGFAFAALLGALDRFGDTSAVMTVSNRTIAGRLGDDVVRHIGASAQVRPVTTLSAIAFRMIADERFAAGESSPRLLNGAEQDALLRGVMAAHLAHADAGDPCDVCGLLRAYFASDDWALAVGFHGGRENGDVPSPGAAGTSGTDAASGVASGAVSGAAVTSDAATTVRMLERGVSSAFIDQLRDILARMDELGVSADGESGLLAAARAQDGHGGRLELQWRLAFALRREYAEAIEHAHPGEYRLDSSRLLVEGAAVLRRGHGPTQPKLVVVDDFQDTTLAGLRFLEALSAAGVRLLLVGNPDEAVQTFRGSYPEYLFAQAVSGPLHALPVTIRGDSDDSGDAGDSVDFDDSGDAGGARSSDGPRTDAGERAATYRDIVSARVCLSIPSPEDDPTPLPDRPGKTPILPGSWPIAPLADDAPERLDGSLASALYRSPREELDDVVWRIKRARLDGDAQWNDMAVIAHDNATVRVFGERLRRDGVPVRYSSVTRPLNEEPFVQGLFALIELARLRRRGLAGVDMPLGRIAAFTRSRVATLMDGPLVTVGAKAGEGRPARLEVVESAMGALESLAAVVDDGGADTAADADTGAGAIGADTDAGGVDESDAGGAGDSAGGALRSLMHAWRELVKAERESRALAVDAPVVDDSLIDPTAIDSTVIGHTVRTVDGDAGPAFGLNALYAMLALDDPHAPAADVVAAIGQVLGTDPQMKAFQRLWRLVGKVADGLGTLAGGEPQFALALAWDATGVARAWQTAALANAPEGRAANDRLDTAMRLFQYAEGGTAGHDIVQFIAQVRAMQIEADSLAHIGPVEQAVTLTTPAGAAGRHWPYVWMPAIQQDVWPNLAERNTMFGGEDLTDIILRGRLEPVAGGTGDPRLASVLSSEKKSLLVALTRATRLVTVSAVDNDDLTPSDFLYGYLPERYSRTRKVFAAVGEKNVGEDNGGFAGLDADPRGLVAAARVVLASHPIDSEEARDAAATLALLAEHGIESADPDNWTYPPIPDEPVGEHGQAGAEPASQASSAPGTSTSAKAPMASLSPSSVDRLWECPVCWMLENTFAGPRPGSVATGFGTLIHAIAQRGSEEGLDRPDFMAGATHDERLAAVRDGLVAIYDELRTDPADIDDPASRYAAIRKDEKAGDTLENIAAYFVDSGEKDYLGPNAKHFDVGRLEQASCEEEFAARFNLDDILAAYNATPGVTAIDRHTLSELMGTLVGGWPEGMSDDLIVRLSGRIDRKETRVMPDGGENIRLIDYKTGQVPGTGQIVNDLQLVCYQLGLTFPESRDAEGRAGFGRRGAKALAVAPRIGQSALFHVEHRDSPAASWAPEGLHQPSLFTAGSLNARAYTPRSHFPNPLTILDMPALDPETRPDGLDIDDAAWRGFTSLNGTQALWSLTMIARVFYAAAASRSEHLTAHPTAAHLQYCRMIGVCPACSGEVDTVFETRQA